MRFLIRNAVLACVSGAILLAFAGAFVGSERFASAQVRAGEQGPPPKSLDQQLLDDLDDDLFEGIPPAQPPAEPATSTAGGAAPQQPSGAASELDQQLLDQLGIGEDISLGKPPDAFTRIGQRMRVVEEMIGQQKNTSARTQQVQEEILEELAALIQQVQKQCSGGQGEAKPGSSSSSGKPANQPGNPTDKPSSRPADDSTDRLGSAEEAAAQADARQDLLKAAWGHLPQRVREQMQSGGVEQFLPKYEKLIEQYYQRLAETPDSFP